MHARLRLVGARRLAALLLATTAGLTTGLADAKGLIPCIAVGANVDATTYVSRLSATVSDGSSNGSVFAWLDRTGVARARVATYMGGKYHYGSGELQEFSVDPALNSGRAAGTFEYYGRTFNVDLTLVGSGAPQLGQPGVRPGWWCYGYVSLEYQTAEVFRSATGTGTVSVSGTGTVTDESADGSVAHGVGLPTSIEERL